MEWTISAQQIITLASLIGALSLIGVTLNKPFKQMEEIGKKLDKMDDRLDKLSDSVEIQGDMVYQLLDHAATNNNSGEMDRCLDEYNAAFRHGGKKT